METTGNKGEWSELYALVKMIADKELSAGDANINKIAEMMYPIISIIRYDQSGEIHYNYADIKRNVVIKTSEGKTISIIPVNEFKQEAEYLLAKIKRTKGSAFEIPEVVDFRKKIKAESIKAPSGEKADITIVVHDETTGTTPMLSFSIKSQLGSPATLLNSGKNTNFIYRLTKKLSAEEVNKINEEHSEHDRINEIYKLSALDFVGIEPSSRNGDMYFCNLVNIDASLPQILACFIVTALRHNLTTAPEIISKVTELNPLHFNTTYHHPYYETKFKRLLTDAALGMTPAKMWSGKYQANGGYIVVRQDGEIVCYHIYNKNEFEDYLYNNVKIDFPSRSRYDYGYIYDHNGEQHINLNSQIRFIK